MKDDEEIELSPIEADDFTLSLGLIDTLGGPKDGEKVVGMMLSMKGTPSALVVPLDKEKAVIVRDALNEAIERLDQWKRETTI